MDQAQADAPRIITVDSGHRGDPQQIVIGRPGPGIDYPVDDEYASTRHAAIKINSIGIVTVQDLGSTNGTFFNGARVWDSTTIHEPGGVLKVGHTLIAIRLANDWLSKVTSDSVQRPYD
jgi:pSer/pThr/pTyr-binding forkhead associated (FHA) protein